MAKRMGLFVAFCLMTTMVFAETMEITLEYPQLTVAERDGFVDVRLPGCELLQCPGAPALPVFGEQVVLPRGTVAAGIEVVDVTSVRIPCGLIRPAQPPAILGPIGVERVQPAIVLPDLAVYEGTELYPHEVVAFRGCGHFGGLPVASCEVHPVQYDPATGDVVLHTAVTVSFDLEPDPAAAPGTGVHRDLDRVTQKILGSRMRGAENLPREWERGQAWDVNPSDYQYVIVTSEAQESAYQTYADWKTAKGVPATVVTVEWIDANYAGRDLAERIRNFIIEAVDEWGTSYVLLGGDEHIVPSRVSWAFDCEAGFYPDENDLYADLYYSDLDGTWDANGNSIFGEVDDGIDFYPDILVGRSPTDDLSEATATVNKFLTYEKTPPVGYAMEAFYFAEILWSDPYTDSGVGKDMIADRHFSAAYDPIERQYESLGNESVSSVISYLNWGPHLANHAGHANYAVMGCGDGYLGRDAVEALTNGPRYFALYSIGCWAAAFDYGCIGEYFIVNGNGAAVAFVGNSRYGWGSPGNPGWGYSETFDTDFYGAILSEGLTQFGAAVAWAKILRIPYSQDANVYRWHQYQVNLLGDPEMMCHTAEISAMVLDSPTTIPIGSTGFTATVTDANGPVEGARLCLAGSDVYQVGLTDNAGQLMFSLDLPGALALTLTATAANHIHAEAAITAAGNDPFLAVVSTTVDDDGIAPSSGNGDGRAAAGETVEFFVTVRNCGGSDATGVTGTLSETSPWVTVVEDVASYGTVPGGDDVANGAPFVFEVLPGCPEGEAVDVEILFQDDGSASWVALLPVIVVAPGPGFDHYVAFEASGDGDGIIEPGETVTLTVYIRNDGGGDTGPVSASLGTTDVNLAVTQGSASTGGSMEPGEVAVLSPSFEVRVESWCPETTYGLLDIAFSHGGGNDDDTFLLAVGQAGLEDDMESGEGGWTHAGTNDLWHLTDHRCHSGTHSWYCGTAGHQYQNNTNAALFTPEFVVPDSGHFSFWCYFDVTIYGVDGMFVELWNGGEWHRLDYIGSGGALDSTLFVCDWAEQAYDLSEFAPGSTAQVRFWLKTDGTDTAEGFYVDDVVIMSLGGQMTAVETPGGCEAGAISFSLRCTSPNPMGDETCWRLSLPGAGHVSAHIYDARGRLVTTLADGFMTGGDHEFRWNGRTERGARAPAGVFFLRLRAGNSEAVRKIIRLQ
ncbi:MAG: hypothetical protein KAW17_00030 [Candidatus Eisenbacteria sp.]|nr:hypothetical protein [Candidatus Eisenbacteria bacterium]